VRANGVLSAGDPVRVTGIDGLTLDVVREQRSQ
jgi:membrane protein implicated in regulation of membrane protease activity